MKSAETLQDKHSQATPLRPARTQRSTPGLYKLYPTRRNHWEKAWSCRVCLITPSRQEITFKMPLPSFQQLSDHAYLHFYTDTLSWLCGIHGGSHWPSLGSWYWLTPWTFTHLAYPLLPTEKTGPSAQDITLRGSLLSSKLLLSSLSFLRLSCLIFNCISNSSLWPTNTASPRSPQLRHPNIMGLDHEGIALTNRPSNGFMM